MGPDVSVGKVWIKISTDEIKLRQMMMASLLALSEDVHRLRNKINVLYVVVEVAQVVLLVIVGDAN